MSNKLSIESLGSGYVQVFSFCRKEAIGRKEQVGTSDILLAIVKKAGENCMLTGRPVKNKELKLLINLGLIPHKELYVELKRSMREERERGLPTRLDGAKMSCSTNFSHAVFLAAKIAKRWGYKKLNSGILLTALVKLQRGTAYNELKRFKLDIKELKKETLKIWKPITKKD